MCLAALETPLEKSSCDDGFPGPRCMKKLICWRLANGKRTVAVLPAESIVHFAFEDLARTGFEILDQFGERNLSGETAKNMDMIRHSSDLKRSTVQSSQSSGQISMRRRSDFRRRQKWTSIFGGENNVDQDQSEGLSHALNTSLCCCHALSCALTGRVVKGVPFPGLKPWAESSCPFGTKNHPKLP